jgi:hypothetical protein
MPRPAAAVDEVRKSFIQGEIPTVISPLWKPASPRLCGAGYIAGSLLPAGSLVLKTRAVLMGDALTISLRQAIINDGHRYFTVILTVGTAPGRPQKCILTLI